MDIRKIDALELLKTLEDKSVDLILTDPPYYKYKDVSWDNQWKTRDEYLNWLEEIIKECQRVLKNSGSFYMFASAQMSWHVEGLIRKYLNVLNHIRWRDKESPSKRGKKESLRKYLNNSEEIIFAEQFNAEENCNKLRRTFKLTPDIPYNNTWYFKQDRTKKGRHPCEKPEELISHIINVSSNENDLVLDIFTGSCSIPKCCEKLNRRCIAGDIDDTYF